MIMILLTMCIALLNEINLILVIFKTRAFIGAVSDPSSFYRHTNVTNYPIIDVLKLQIIQQSTY